MTQGAVSQWLRRVEATRGVEGLYHRRSPGAVPRLTGEQRSQLPDLLKEGAPSFGFEGDMWTRERVATVVERIFGVPCHPTFLARYCPERTDPVCSNFRFVRWLWLSITLRLRFSLNTNLEQTQTTILVVDDEKTLRDMLGYNLRREGYGVFIAADGDEAIRLAFAVRPDLVILDIMLPGMNGFEVVRAIRKELTTPILMLSAREDEIDKVLGLELGADDYLTKPFGLRELLARVGAMLRRTEMLRAENQKVAESGSEGARGTLIVGDLTLNLGQRTVIRAGKQAELKPKEFDLLAFLAAHPMQVFSRDTLLDRVWGIDFVGGTRTVDVHISWLRAKLEHDPANPKLIQTVYGVGYRFNQPMPVVPSGPQ